MEITEADLVHHRRLRESLACWERQPRYLELRIVLLYGEELCGVKVEEGEDAVEVVVFVCGEPTGTDGCDVPAGVWLDRALDGRRVLDAARGGAPVRVASGVEIYGTSS